MYAVWSESNSKFWSPFIHGIFFFRELVEKGFSVGKSAGMCGENFWLIAVGVQCLEQFQYWMEVRKINHIARTDEK